MKNNYSEAMSQCSDAELLRIVNEEKNDYQPEAVKSAELELKNRNLSNIQVQQATLENETSKQVKTEKANAELSGIWKFLTFIFPGIIQLLFVGSFRADGYVKKANELKKWTFFGFSFYIGIVLLLKLIN